MLIGYHVFITMKFVVVIRLLQNILSPALCV